MNFIRKEFNCEYYDSFLYRVPLDSPRNQNRLNMILSRKKKGKLLEIGCGKGEFLKLTNRYFNVEGVDISESALTTTDECIKDKVRYFDIECPQPLANHYDVIAAFNVLEHLEQPQRAIKKIFQGLPERGLFIGSVPCKAGALGRVHTALTNLFDRTHISTYPPRRWRALFRNIGFRQVLFFGEIMLGRVIAMYINSKFWKYLSFNLMFTCEK